MDVRWTTEDAEDDEAMEMMMKLGYSESGAVERKRL